MGSKKSRGLVPASGPRILASTRERAAGCDRLDGPAGGRMAERFDAIISRVSFWHCQCLAFPATRFPFGRPRELWYVVSKVVSKGLSRSAQRNCRRIMEKSIFCSTCSMTATQVGSSSGQTMKSSLPSVTTLTL